MVLVVVVVLVQPVEREMYRQRRIRYDAVIPDRCEIERRDLAVLGDTSFVDTGDFLFMIGSFEKGVIIVVFDFIGSGDDIQGYFVDLLEIVMLKTSP